MKKQIFAILESILLILMLAIVSVRYLFFQQQPDNFAVMAILILAISSAERSIIEKIDKNEQSKNNQN